MSNELKKKIFTRLSDFMHDSVEDDRFERVNNKLLNDSRDLIIDEEDLQYARDWNSIAHDIVGSEEL